MLIQEWIEAGKPIDVSFSINRRLDLSTMGDNIQEVEAWLRLMARLIIESFAFHTDGKFVVDKLSDWALLANPYLFEYEGHPFGAIYSDGCIMVGAVARKIQ